MGKAQEAPEEKPRREPDGRTRMRRVVRTQEAGAPQLERLIHERVRLGILSALAATETMSFSDLKTLLKASDGNLSVHARKLEDAEYLECMKTFEGRVPKTEFRLTALGRQALERYLDHMEALIRAARGRA